MIQLKLFLKLMSRKTFLIESVKKNINRINKYKSKITEKHYS